MRHVWLLILVALLVVTTLFQGTEGAARKGRPPMDLAKPTIISLCTRHSGRPRGSPRVNPKIVEKCYKACFQAMTKAAKADKKLHQALVRNKTTLDEVNKITPETKAPKCFKAGG